MKKNRFDHLEPQKEPALPAALQKALSRIQRFDHLEIGELAMNVTQQVDRVLCAHCGQYNEKVRTHCWACLSMGGEKASPPVPRPDLELILDGKRYHSADADLPEDVRTLMDWIQRDGYSKELLAKWRQWRATRNQAIYRAKIGRRLLDAARGPMTCRCFAANGSPSSLLTANDTCRWTKTFRQILKPFSPTYLKTGSLLN
jgi:hypothetical protein